MATMLPVLDLADADADLDAFRAALREAAHGYGFFYLTGHGVPRERSPRCLRLARQFFALPEAAKDEISQLKSPQFRGYSRLGGELTNGTVDWREQIDIGPERAGHRRTPAGYWRLQGPNLWPSALPALAAGVRAVECRRCPASGCGCCGTGRCRWARRRTCSTRPSRTDRPP